MFWYSDPSVLFRKDTWYVFVPTATMSVSDALNSVVRFSVYLSVLLFLTTMQPTYLLFIPVVMFVTVLLDRIFPEAKKITERFYVSSYTGVDESRPTTDNPFMNPALTDILDNPAKPPAADVTRTDVRDEVNQAFAQTSNIYMDTSDVFDIVQAQRNFHTVPTDDHAGLLRFLGKGSTSGKIGNESYVVAKGTVAELPTASVTTAPSGTSLRR